jgi:hypothetical protein
MRNLRQFLIAVTGITLIPSIVLLFIVVTNKTIKTQGIEIIEFELPKIVSRFDLDSVTNKIPEAGSKIEQQASRIVEDVSSKASSISNVLDKIPHRVTLGMDKVCWNGPQECTSIWKGLDGWFPVPLEDFIKIEDPPVFLEIFNAKDNVLRLAICLSLVFCFLAFFLSLWLTWSFLKGNKILDGIRLRYEICTIVVISLFTLLPLILSLVLVASVHIVLGQIIISPIDRSSGRLPLLLTFSLGLNMISLTCFLIWRNGQPVMPRKI